MPGDQAAEVEFTVLEEGQTTEPFRFTLARDSKGNPDWNVAPVNAPPPSLKKHMVALTVRVAGGEPMANGVVDDTPTDVLLDRLDVLASQKADVKLIGYDGRTYYVRVDPTSMKSVIIEGKSAADRVHGVTMTCWSVYRATDV